MADKVVIRLINPRSPEQVEDSAPEQIVVYHWRRIVAALAIAVLLLVGIIAGVRHILQPSDGAAKSPAGQVDAPAAKPNAAAAAHPAALPEVQAAHKPGSLGSASAQPEPNASQPANAGTKATVYGAAHTVENPSSRVLIRSRNIRRAQLTSNVVNGQPVDELNGGIPMNAKGLIKVFLHMETTGLKGRILYHDWYWKDKLIAHARIPVKRNDQNSATSKYIDRIMKGPWQVKIVDDRKKVYAEVRFEVR